MNDYQYEQAVLLSLQSCQLHSGEKASITNKQTVSETEVSLWLWFANQVEKEI